MCKLNLFISRLHGQSDEWDLLSRMDMSKR